MPRLHIGNTPKQDFPVTVFCEQFNILGDEMTVVFKGDRKDLARAREMFDSSHVQYPFRFDILNWGDLNCLGGAGVFTFSGCVYAYRVRYQGPDHVEIELKMKITAEKYNA